MDILIKILELYAANPTIATLIIIMGLDKLVKALPVESNDFLWDILVTRVFYRGIRRMIVGK